MMEKKYYRHKLENLIVVDDIVTIHYLELEKDFSYPQESHDFWELIYVDKRSVAATSDGVSTTVGEGEILFHKPNKVHAHSANGVDAPNVFIISFVCKSRAMHFFEDKKLTVPKNLVRFIYYIAEEGKRTFNLPYYDPNMTKMELLPEAALGGEQLIKNYLEILLINLMRNETEHPNSGVVFLQRDEGERDVSAKVIAYLKENITERLSIADICDAVHYNRSYIFRVFKRETGDTVMNYFTRLKIERSKQLLREGKLNIAQISERLSFDTANYFTKTFKKLTGYSPANYKKIYLASK